MGGPSTEARATRPVVVLACAERDASKLTPVVRALVDHGARVELVPGVDRRVRALEMAVDAQGDRALYVLCHSEQLDRYQGDLLELTVRAGEVGDRRLVSAWFDPDDVRPLIETVTGRLRELTRPEAGPLATPSAALELTPAYAAADASASTSVPATTLIAARAALGYRRLWTALGIGMLVAIAVVAAIYVALGPDVAMSWMRALVRGG